MGSSPTSTTMKNKWIENQKTLDELIDDYEFLLKFVLDSEVNCIIRKLHKHITKRALKNCWFTPIPSCGWRTSNSVSIMDVFARSSQQPTEEEKKRIEKILAYLGE